VKPVSGVQRGMQKLSRFCRFWMARRWMDSYIGTVFKLGKPAIIWKAWEWATIKVDGWCSF
jgi:hypothetical protein